MTTKKRFSLNNPYASLSLWQHPISTDHIVIKIQEWEDDMMEGTATAGILLSVEKMIRLKAVLEYEISKITKSSNN